MEILMTELNALFWVLIGFAVLAFGMWLSDIWTGFIDQTVWRQKKDRDLFR